MRTVVHLSDLHFGRINDTVLAPLRAQITGLKPDVVVISGDLTQRAKTGEFQAARRFLDTLPAPQIVVPGNHDVPLYNVFVRFLKPLNKYRLHITPDLEPFHVDGEIAVLGINTARSLTFKGGRINEEQIARVRARLAPVPADVTKILVTHHPFDLPAGHDHKELVGRASNAMKTFADCGVDVLLSGHLHLGHTASTNERYPSAGRGALVVQAGTATSTRGRGEPNSYNVLRIDKAAVTVDRLEWNPATEAFDVSKTECFRYDPRGWVAQP